MCYSTRHSPKKQNSKDFSHRDAAACSGMQFWQAVQGNLVRCRAVSSRYQIIRGLLRSSARSSVCSSVLQASISFILSPFASHPGATILFESHDIRIMKCKSVRSDAAPAARLKGKTIPYQVKVYMEHGWLFCTHRSNCECKIKFFGGVTNSFHSGDLNVIVCTMRATLGHILPNLLIQVWSNGHSYFANAKPWGRMP